MVFRRFLRWVEGYLLGLFRRGGGGILRIGREGVVAALEHSSNFAGKPHPLLNYNLLNLFFFTPE